tara:strand:- start:1918 stop:2517 length:600 start_codon:yes stop_codon:yes gene_type:complete
MAADETYSKPSPDRAEFDETPESKYPYNRVTQMPGGMRLVIGEERGKESMKIYHPSGTYMEMFPDGKMASMTIGENKQYNKSGTTVTVDENGDIHFTGHQKITMGGGSHIEVSGDAGIVVGGSTVLTSLGDMGMSVKGNMYMGVDGDMNMNVTGNMNTLVGGKNYVGSGAPMTVQATQLNLNPADGQSGYTPTSGPQKA